MRWSRRPLSPVRRWPGCSLLSARFALPLRGRCIREESSVGQCLPGMGVSGRPACLGWTALVPRRCCCGSPVLLVCPNGCRDVLGLAVRVWLEEGGRGDLLLATTGAGRWGRFLLRLARRRGAFYSGLFHVPRSLAGPLLLAGCPLDDDGCHFEFVCARPGGRWSSFGRLSVRPAIERGHDTSTAFDPVLNVVPGLDSYAWAAHLRRFAYAASRRARAAPLLRMP